MKRMTMPRVGRQSGFTLIELMVALAIGLLIVAALIALLLNLSRNNNELSKTNRMIENGADYNAWNVGAKQKLTDAFAKYGWCTAIRGAENGGKVENLPMHVFSSDALSILANGCTTQARGRPQLSFSEPAAQGWGIRGD